MPRSRASAKQAGSRFERLVADHLAQHLDDRIDRRPRGGAKDLGDIGGVRTATGQRVVIECKDTTRAELAAWIREAHTEAGNDDAAVGVVAHKRRGIGYAGDQYVTMTLDDLIVLLGGERPSPITP